MPTVRLGSPRFQGLRCRSFLCAPSFSELLKVAAHPQPRYPRDMNMARTGQSMIKFCAHT
jgi:hypothetical protein